MKYLKFLFSLILFSVYSCSTLYSQGTFAPIGAKWNFTSDSEILLSTSLKDTLIQGQTCQTIKTDTYNTFNTPTNQLVKQDSLFVFEQNDSVYYFNKNYNEFLLLYDFTAAKGDTLGFVAPLEKHSFFMVVDSIKETTHNQEPLKYFYVRGTDPNGWHFTNSGGIWVEQVGSVNTLFLPEMGERIAISFPILVCYQNEENDSFTFPEFSTYDCLFDIIDTTDDLIDEYNQVAIYPNPTIGLIHVSLDAASAFLFPVCYELFNLNGASMLKGQAFEKEWELNLSHLPPGMYLMKLTDRKNGSDYKKIVII